MGFVMGISGVTDLLFSMVERPESTIADVSSSFDFSSIDGWMEGGPCIFLIGSLSIINHFLLTLIVIN